MTQRIAWIAVGIVLNALTVWGITFFVINSTTAGFQAATSTLSNQVVDLSNRLESSTDTLAQQIAERVAAAQATQYRRSDDLATELRDLTGQLRETTATLVALSESVGRLDTTVQSVDEKLTSSIVRQEKFEQFVVGVLIQAPPPPIRTFDEIQKQWGVDEGVYLATVTPIAEGKSVFWSFAE